MPTSNRFDTTLLGTDLSFSSAPLAQQVADHLRKLIMENMLEPGSRLPNEPDLSAQLKVSRSTIRSSLTILEQGGFIQRRWGVGTFVAQDPPTYSNLQLNSGVTQMIRSSGAQPGCAELLITTRPASEHVANRLSVEPGVPIVVIERVRLANDARVVFMLDYLPESLVHPPEFDIPLPERETFIKDNRSVYTFLSERLSLDIHHGIAWIRPVSAEGYIAERLQVPRCSSLLHVEQVDFPTEVDPFALSDEYYVADAFSFYIYRSS